MTRKQCHRTLPGVDPLPQPRLFRRYPRATLLLLTGMGLAVATAVAELTLRYALGLGSPVLYALHPAYGYRPRPDQSVFRRAHVRINNIGLRGLDWDRERKNKILFLGDSVTYGGSFINNRELFSELAVVGLEGWQSGNAGVNAWGVENVHGLVVGADFTPAAVYVTTLLERDFHRGLTRISGLPYWCRAPGSALEEAAQQLLPDLLQLDGCAKSALGAAPQIRAAASVERAVRRLAEMDAHLKRRGLLHLIFISPTRAQLVEGHPKNVRLQKLLLGSGLKVTYLQDEAALARVSAQTRAGWFVDHHHLSRQGHAAWARVIRAHLEHHLKKTGSGDSTSGAGRAGKTGIK